MSGVPVVQFEHAGDVISGGDHVTLLPGNGDDVVVHVTQIRQDGRRLRGYGHPAVLYSILGTSVSIHSRQRRKNNYWLLYYAFEMKGPKKILRVSSTAKKTNEWVSNIGLIRAD